jgi:adenylate kinase
VSQNANIQTTRKGRVVVIMGPPNAGKDTQAQLLAHTLHGDYIGSGELIRREAEPRLMEIMARGDLVPAEDFRRLISKAIADVPLGRPTVLAGIAKRPEEASWLVEHLPSLGRWLDKVILITVGKEVSLLRSKSREGHRQDDNPDVQGVRWDRFYQQTSQSLEYFDHLGVLVRVNGEGSEAEVADVITSALRL